MKWWVIGKIIEQGTIKGFIIQNENNYRLCILKSHIKDYNIVSYRVTSDNKLIGKPIIEYDYSKLVGLYHGSKSGLQGKVKPVSRDSCDFGKGFYLGTNSSQVIGIASRGKNPKVYNIILYTDGLKMYNLTRDVETWVLFIGYCRDIIPRKWMSRKCINYLQNIEENSDIIYGNIADDRLSEAYAAFTRKSISLEQLMYCLNYVKYGVQYTLKSEKACNQIISISEINHRKYKVNNGSYPKDIVDYASTLPTSKNDLNILDILHKPRWR